MVVFNIGRSDSTVYRLWELIPFMLIGCIGGLMGAAFIAVNVKVMKWRRDLIRGRKWHLLAEVMILSVVCSTLFFAVPFAAQCESVGALCFGCSCFNQAHLCLLLGVCMHCLMGVCCREIMPRPASFTGSYGTMKVTNFTCTDGTYNPIASLLFTPQSVAVRNLFSRGTADEFSLRSTGIFWFVYTATAALVAGSATSAGLLVPTLLAGASFGRFCGIAMRMITGKTTDIDPGIYALIGASAFFGGVTRMTMYVAVLCVHVRCRG
jgi:chloride channel 7